MISWREDNEVDEQDRDHLAKFRRMIAESQNELIKFVEFPDDILLRVIRRPEVDLITSLEIITHIVRARFTTHIIEVERGYPSEIQHVFEKRIFGVLKQRDQLGRAVVWFRLSRWDPNEIPEEDLTIAACITAWEVLESKITQQKGVVGIFDASGCTLAHVKLASPQKMQRQMKLFFQCNPFHIGGGHIMFAPMLFNIIFSIFKQFLPNKYAKLLHFNGKNTRKLHEHVPKSILPNFFGGILTEKEATNESLIEDLLKKDAYYKDIIQLGKKEFFQKFPEKRIEFEQRLCNEILMK